MATLVETALEIKKWAKTNQLFGNKPIQLDVNENLIRGIFGRVGIPMSKKILQDRQIAFIGIDPESEKIIIFLDKTLTRSQAVALATLATAGLNQEYDIVFRKGSVPHVGGKLMPPIVPPFEEHNDKYTCGSSVYIGSEKGAGTLGALVKDAAGVIYGLSNSHVTGGSNYAELNLPILAPGSLDIAPGGRDPETIGHHAKACPLIDGLPEIVDSASNLDAALFKILDPARVSSHQRKHHDTPTNVMHPTVGMSVAKVGRTTGRTKGTIVAVLPDAEAVLYDVDIIGGRKLVYFCKTFVIESNTDGTPFSMPGDSGSLITHTDDQGAMHAVGLLFAGDGVITWAVPVNEVLEYFAVELVGGHNV